MNINGVNFLTYNNTSISSLNNIKIKEEEVEQTSAAFSPEEKASSKTASKQVTTKLPDIKSLFAQMMQMKLELMAMQAMSSTDNTDVEGSKAEPTNDEAATKVSSGTLGNSAEDPVLESMLEFIDEFLGISNLTQKNS